MKPLDIATEISAVFKRELLAIDGFLAPILNEKGPSVLWILYVSHKSSQRLNSLLFVGHRTSISLKLVFQYYDVYL